MLIDPDLGKKNPEQDDVDTYCDITGFTRSNGDKPNTESICKALNEKLVPFEGITKNIDMDGYTVKNLGLPVTPQKALATRGYTIGHILINSINPSVLQPGLVSINSFGAGITTTEIKTILLIL